MVIYIRTMVSVGTYDATKDYCYSCGGLIDDDGTLVLPACANLQGPVVRLALYLQLVLSMGVRFVMKLITATVWIVSRNTKKQKQ